MMTMPRSFRWIPPLAALLACVLLAVAAHAQETPPERDDRTAALFHIGMTALAEAEQADSDEARQDLYDKAIDAFRAILVNHPELVRVRLELARAFFLKGQDGLARVISRPCWPAGYRRPSLPTSGSFWPSCRPASA